MTSQSWRCTGFGIELRSELPLDGVPAGAGGVEPPPVDVVAAEPRAVIAAFSGEPPGSPLVAYRVAELAYRQRRGNDGDLLAMLGDGDACFHLDAGARRILAAVRDPTRCAWRRVLLDAVLAAAAARRGAEGLHGAAIATASGALAICAPAGAGKSTLLAELLRRGLPFVSDDVLFLSRRGDAIVAHPGPCVATLAAGAPLPGPVLGTLGDERWVAVPNAVSGPLTLAAICLLRRNDDHSGEPRVQRIRPAPQDLLGNVLLTGDGPQRTVARLDLMADVATAVPLLTLTARTDATPAALADALLAGVGAL